MLAVAIVSEVIATLALKASDGFSKLQPSIVVIAGYALSFALLGLALSRGLPMGLAYATWAAIGTATIAILGVLLFAESLSLQAMIGLGMIIVGVVLLHLNTEHGIKHEEDSAASVSEQREVERIYE
ncbi:DMT family transporter [Rhodococcus indonesiensis]|uniref:DMT family transporter n=1 Tax=Rhodococcus indonesiensis TaxID=3055869 RepID=UPI0039F65BF6